MRRGWFERLAKQPEPLATEPPADVLAAIDAAHIVPRHKAGEDDARAFVMLPGRRGFILTEERAEAAVQATFQDLNPEQVKRATQFLMTRARLALRQSTQAAEHDERPRWRDWKPLSL